MRKRTGFEAEAYSYWVSVRKGVKGAVLAGAAAAAVLVSQGQVDFKALKAAFIAGAAGFIVTAGRNWQKNR